jgi:hypothetical protein
LAARVYDEVLDEEGALFLCLRVYCFKVVPPPEACVSVRQAACVCALVLVDNTFNVVMEV